jgi:allantoinase
MTARTSAGKVSDRGLADAEVALRRCDELAAMTGRPGRIDRFHLTADHAAVNDLVASWMAPLGLARWQDAAGNLCGRLEGSIPGLPALVLGSHLDTVPDGGLPEFPPLDGGQLRGAMREIAGFGGLLLEHAEDPGVLADAPAAPSPRFRDFVASRPEDAEVTAIRTVLDGVRAFGTRAHVVHLSSARALDDLAAARGEGLPVTVETCPHYLVFDADELPDGAPEFTCCPPIRDRGNQAALWAALGEGLIDCVVSDHSPSTEQEKRRAGGDPQQAWGGIAGLQVGLLAVADAAARRGIGVEEVSRWMAEGPARLVGLGTKGRIEAGRDADLVWYDPEPTTTVAGDFLAHRNRLSAYTGRVLRAL